jgi:hypothetical protein
MNRLGEYPSSGIEQSQQLAPTRFQAGGMLFNNMACILKRQDRLLLRLSGHAEDDTADATERLQRSGFER